jgi:hypothetical protein
MIYSRSGRQERLMPTPPPRVNPYEETCCGRPNSDPYERDLGLKLSFRMAPSAFARRVRREGVRSAISTHARTPLRDGRLFRRRRGERVPVLPVRRLPRPLVFRLECLGVELQGLKPFVPDPLPQRELVMLVEPKGFEPSTSSMPSRRAPNCATAPRRFTSIVAFIAPRYR